MTQLRTLSGNTVTGLTFGTMQFGGRADTAASRAMYDACRAAGVTHFDTAWVYTEGASETLLGQFIAAEREDVFIASKVAYTGGAGRENVLAQAQMSLGRMGIDVIDLMYLHRFDPSTDLRESLGTLADLQARGTIRHIGLSNFAAWQVMKAQAIAAEFGTRIDVIQPMYSLVKRQAEVELLPMCADQGILAVPYSPLGGGLLTGKYATGGTGRLTEDTRYAARYGLPWMHEAAKGLAKLAETLGVDPATLAVAWVAAHDSRPSPIISARDVGQLRPSLDAAGFEMTAELYAQITALSITPPPATDRIEEA
ncbi:MAG: aldo/keto reductase [Pseudomonadota bacterium]